MSATITLTRGLCLANPFDRVVAAYRELQRRQAPLASAALLSLIALVPVLLAHGLDARTIHGISVWTKPAKFLVSFAVYYATLAWVFGYLPRAAQETRTGRFVVAGALLAGGYEMAWMLLAAAAGVPSHFNPSPLWAIAYGVAGLGAVTLIGVILLQGVLVLRAPRGVIAPALRTALVLGAVIAFGATLVTAGFLSSGSGHWVGGVPSDAGALPLIGWSRTGGDLRVAHFWALHAQQTIPLVGLALVRFGRPNARAAVWVAALFYLALVVYTFVQALSGQPFLAFVA